MHINENNGIIFLIYVHIIKSNIQNHWINYRGNYFIITLGCKDIYIKRGLKWR